MALFLCCCGGPRPCVLNVSTGYAVTGAWKLDALAPPAASQPHCRYFRTLTLTVADTLGTVFATIVMRHTIEQGGFGPGGVPTSAPAPALTITGGNPCLAGGSLQSGAITNRTETGMTVALTGVNGCTFTGSVRYEFSDETSVGQLEAAAQVLASLVDWNSFPSDKNQLVYYQNGSIVNELIPSIGNAGAPTINWCGNSGSGVFGVAGTGSWIVYYQATFPRPPGFEWLPLTSFTPAGNWPYLRVFGKSWNARLVIPGSWCQYTGPLVRDSQGVPTRCGISAFEMTCGAAAGSVQNLTGGTMTFFPAGSMVYTKVGCGGLGATCA